MAPVHSVLTLWPGVTAAPLQTQAPDSIIQAWDSVTGQLVDSVVVRSPLPDPLVPIVQWIFQRPGWVMIGGLILAGIVVLAGLVVLWRRRRSIWTLLATRDRGVKLALGFSVGTILLLILGTGGKTYDYIMHDNDFCRGCHIFVPSGQVFVRPDTGTYLLVNKPEGKHDTLSCHACHPFNLKTQTKELFYWMVARPDKIPPHGKVPREICEQCHVTGPAKVTWKRITTTAGHRTHLESDSAALKNVGCLTCHARTAHRFQPADTTCAQKGCHLTDEIKIRLGRMAARFEPARLRPLPNEEQLYCNSCHQFTADAQFLAPDSALALLRPASRQCFKCHEMRVLLASFDPAQEPHGGACGMCHNPHTDVKPANALKSCTDAQCHADWRKIDFHTGAAHRKVAVRCEVCHVPHAARVDASDCVGCHQSVRYGPRSRLRPPLPFDTTKALRQSSSREPPRGLVAPGRARGQGAAPPEEDPPRRRTDIQVSPRDSFPHARHRRIACLTCHDLRSKGRTLTFEVPRGCQICHHQRPTRANCSVCHQESERAELRPVTVQVAVFRHGPRTRQVNFAHQSHRDVACVKCHQTPVTMAPSPEAANCTGCHENHHVADRDCGTCHRTAEIVTAHQRPVDPHIACSRCHDPATIAALTPSRSFCLACHDPQKVDHYAPKQCTVCHLQASPEDYRPRLARASSRR
jgi:hypothetical protein